MAVLNESDHEWMTEDYSYEYGPTAFAYMPSGRSVLVCVAKNIYVYSTVSGDHIATFTVPEHVLCSDMIAVFVSPDSDRVLAIGSNGVIHVWDLVSGKEAAYRTLLLPGPLIRFCVARDCQHVVTTYSQNMYEHSTITIARLSAAPGDIVRRFQAPCNVSSMCLSPDATIAYFTAEESIYIVDLNTEATLRQLTVPPFQDAGQAPWMGIHDRVQVPTISDDGKFFAAVLRRDKATRVYVWALENAVVDTPAFTIGDAWYFSGVCISPNSKYVAVNDKSSVHVWSIQTQSLVLTINTTNLLKQYEFSPDSRHMFTTNVLSYEKRGPRMRPTGFGYGMSWDLTHRPRYALLAAVAGLPSWDKMFNARRRGGGDGDHAIKTNVLGFMGWP